MRTLENAARRWGFYRVAGCDEVGRGCLAGPVVAGAVILDPDRHIPGLADSKMLTQAARERLYDVITRKALAWAVAGAEPTEIDAVNIHRASLAAMRRALLMMSPLPDLVLVDAFRIPDLLFAQRAVLHGDRRCSAIAAASIIAKVTRDREMHVHHQADPRYGYDRHKGYATAEHLAAVARHGYSALHRRTFRPPSLFDALTDPSQVGDADIADDNAGAH
jgi:ribonuclease HII